MRFKIGDKINSIGELRMSWAEDQERWYEYHAVFDRTPIRFSIVGWNTHLFTVKKESGKEFIFCGSQFPHTIIADPRVPAETELQRIARERGIEPGTWLTYNYGLFLFDGNDLTRYWGLVSDHGGLCPWNGFTGQIVTIRNCKPIDPVAYVRDELQRIYAASTPETAIADTQRKYTILDRAVSIGLLSLEQVPSLLDSLTCPLCKQNYFKLCTDCPCLREGHGCGKLNHPYRKFKQSNTPETWAALYSFIMGLKEPVADVPAVPEVKPGQVWKEDDRVFHLIVRNSGEKLKTIHDVDSNPRILENINPEKDYCFKHPNMTLTDRRVTTISDKEIIITKAEYEALKAAQCEIKGALA